MRRTVPKPTRRAFTLVELLVVIGIIAVLIGILLPSLSKARKAANTTKCLSTVRQLGIAWQMYTQEHKGRSIPYYDLNDELGLWIGQLRGVYAQIDNSRLCPEAVDQSHAPNGWGTVNTAWGPAPNVGFIGNQRGSYAFNGWLYWYNLKGWRAPFQTANDQANFFMFPVPRSAEVPVFCDSAWVDTWPDSTDPPPPNLTSATLQDTSQAMWRICIARHGVAINVAYCDGHAATVPLRQLWNQFWKPNYVPPNPLPTLPRN